MCVCMYNTSPTHNYYYLPLYYCSIVVNIKNIEKQSDIVNSSILPYNYPRDKLFILAALIGLHLFWLSNDKFQNSLV